ncbi:aminotransferase class V-fold PLP-dependent enzyme [Actinocatenispora rupis]|uniref:Aminotransferase class V n=1 Tax=Actinocatenispora rupis TaxID=519421 RepID=A0A8J3N7I8_9ACTN|nr:aminotransferase class V-fold PLP-dependent enzyme [Actinocatenispora rupis]GID09126.1 aminotransferase class V [Actinocatenispora rupis]
MTIPAGKPPEPLRGARLLFSLDPAYAHLNHGSFGALPIPAQRAAARLREEQEADPIRFLKPPGVVERVTHTRRHLARFVGADPDGTALVPNVTAACAIVLGSVPLRPGDEILLTDHAYGAVVVEAKRRCAETGAVLVRAMVGLDATDDEIVAAVSAAVTERTRVAVIDQISSATAKLFPIRRIATELHRRGVYVAVDAAHVPGMIDVDVSSLGADAWFGNLHKWAYAPRGTGLLVVAPEHRSGVRPLVASWEYGNGFPRSVEFQGTQDLAGWLAAPAGLHTMTTLGLDVVRDHNARLARYGQRLLTESLETEPVPTAPELAMRVVRLPDGAVTSESTAVRLRERITTELRTHVAVSFWNGAGLLRLCAQVYNRAGEYERLAATLPGLLRRG